MGKPIRISLFALLFSLVLSVLSAQERLIGDDSWQLRVITHLEQLNSGDAVEDLRYIESVLGEMDGAARLTRTDFDNYVGEHSFRPNLLLRHRR